MQLTSMAPSSKIYSGDPKCPRNVTVQVLNPSPATGNNQCMISTDKGALDSAAPFQTKAALTGQELTEGIDVVDPFGDTVRITLQGVTADLYARGFNVGAGGIVAGPTILIGVLVC